MRARMLILRAVETLAISPDFISVFSELRSYNSAHICQRRNVTRRASIQWLGANYPGGYVDQQLKQLMKELGEAINESLADSEQIAEVVSKIKDGGYDIFLVLEATIGVSKPGDKSS